MIQLLKWLVRLTLFGIFVIVANSLFVAFQAQGALYSDITKLPEKKAALLLGTSKYVVGGGQNYFYTYRIRAAVKVWKAGKVKAIVVSGDNSSQYYDEVNKMYKDLIKEGVPAKYITRDYAGLRTFDSMVRAKEVFGLDDFIVISQKFHLERAICIAKGKGIKAVGYIAEDKEGTPTALKMQLREVLARTRAFLDLYVLGTEPKFLGKREKVKYK